MKFKTGWETPNVKNRWDQLRKQRSIQLAAQQSQERQTQIKTALEVPSMRPLRERNDLFSFGKNKRAVPNYLNSDSGERKLNRMLNSDAPDVDRFAKVDAKSRLLQEDLLKKSRLVKILSEIPSSVRRTAVMAVVVPDSTVPLSLFSNDLRSRLDRVRKGNVEEFETIVKDPRLQGEMEKVTANWLRVEAGRKAQYKNAYERFRKLEHEMDLHSWVTFRLGTQQDPFFVSLDAADPAQGELITGLEKIGIGAWKGSDKNRDAWKEYNERETQINALPSWAQDEAREKMGIPYTPQAEAGRVLNLMDEQVPWELVLAASPKQQSVFIENYKSKHPTEEVPVFGEYARARAKEMLDGMYATGRLPNPQEEATINYLKWVGGNKALGDPEENPDYYAQYEANVAPDGPEGRDYYNKTYGILENELGRPPTPEEVDQRIREIPNPDARPIWGTEFMYKQTSLRAAPANDWFADIAKIGIAPVMALFEGGAALVRPAVRGALLPAIAATYKHGGEATGVVLGDVFNAPGLKNRYGNPNDETYERLRSGEASIKLPDTGIKVPLSPLSTLLGFEEDFGSVDLADLGGRPVYSMFVGDKLGEGIVNVINPANFIPAIPWLIRPLRTLRMGLAGRAAVSVGRREARAVAAGGVERTVANAEVNAYTGLAWGPEVGASNLTLAESNALIRRGLLGLLDEGLLLGDTPDTIFAAIRGLSAVAAAGPKAILKVTPDIRKTNMFRAGVAHMRSVVDETQEAFGVGRQVNAVDDLEVLEMLAAGKEIPPYYTAANERVQRRLDELQTIDDASIRAETSAYVLEQERDPLGFAQRQLKALDKIEAMQYDLPEGALVPQREKYKAIREHLNRQVAYFESLRGADGEIKLPDELSYGDEPIDTRHMAKDFPYAQGEELPFTVPQVTRALDNLAAGNLPQTDLEVALKANIDRRMASDDTLVAHGSTAGAVAKLRTTQSDETIAVNLLDQQTIAAGRPVVGSAGLTVVDATRVLPSELVERVAARPHLTRVAGAINAALDEVRPVLDEMGENNFRFAGYELTDVRYASNAAGRFVGKDQDEIYLNLHALVYDALYRARKGVRRLNSMDDLVDVLTNDIVGVAIAHEPLHSLPGNVIHAPGEEEFQATFLEFADRAADEALRAKEKIRQVLSDMARTGELEQLIDDANEWGLTLAKLVEDRGKKLRGKTIGEINVYEPREGGDFAQHAERGPGGETGDSIYQGLPGGPVEGRGGLEGGIPGGGSGAQGPPSDVGTGTAGRYGRPNPTPTDISPEDLGGAIDRAIAIPGNIGTGVGAARRGEYLSDARRALDGGDTAGARTRLDLARGVFGDYTDLYTHTADDVDALLKTVTDDRYAVFDTVAAIPSGHEVVLIAPDGRAVAMKPGSRRVFHDNVIAANNFDLIWHGWVRTWGPDDVFKGFEFADGEAARAIVQDYLRAHDKTPEYIALEVAPTRPSREFLRDGDYLPQTVIIGDHQFEAAGKMLDRALARHAGLLPPGDADAYLNRLANRLGIEPQGARRFDTEDIPFPSRDDIHISEEGTFSVSHLDEADVPNYKINGKTFKLPLDFDDAQAQVDEIDKFLVDLEKKIKEAPTETGAKNLQTKWSSLDEYRTELNAILGERPVEGKLKKGKKVVAQEPPKTIKDQVVDKSPRVRGGTYKLVDLSGQVDEELLAELGKHKYLTELAELYERNFRKFADAAGIPAERLIFRGLVVGDGFDSALISRADVSDMLLNPFFSMLNRGASASSLEDLANRLAGDLTGQMFKQLGVHLVGPDPVKLSAWLTKTFGEFADLNHYTKSAIREGIKKLGDEKIGQWVSDAAAVRKALSNAKAPTHNVFDGGTVSYALRPEEEAEFARKFFAENPVEGGSLDDVSLEIANDRPNVPQFAARDTELTPERQQKIDTIFDNLETAPNATMYRSILDIPREIINGTKEALPSAIWIAPDGRVLAGLPQPKGEFNAYRLHHDDVIRGANGIYMGQLIEEGWIRALEQYVQYIDSPIGNRLAERYLKKVAQLKPEIKRYVVDLMDSFEPGGIRVDPNAPDVMVSDVEQLGLERTLRNIHENNKSAIRNLRNSTDWSAPQFAERLDDPFTAPQYAARDTWDPDLPEDQRTREWYKELYKPAAERDFSDYPWPFKGGSNAYQRKVNAYRRWVEERTPRLVISRWLGLEGTLPERVIEDIQRVARTAKTRDAVAEAFNGYSIQVLLTKTFAEHVQKGGGIERLIDEVWENLQQLQRAIDEDLTSGREHFAELADTYLNPPREIKFSAGDRDFYAGKERARVQEQTEEARRAEVKTGLETMAQRRERLAREGGNAPQAAGRDQYQDLDDPPTPKEHDLHLPLDRYTGHLYTTGAVDELVDLITPRTGKYRDELNLSTKPGWSVANKNDDGVFLKFKTEGLRGRVRRYSNWVDRWDEGSAEFEIRSYTQQTIANNLEEIIIRAENKLDLKQAQQELEALRGGAVATRIEAARDISMFDKELATELERLELAKKTLAELNLVKQARTPTDVDTISRIDYLLRRNRFLSDTQRQELKDLQEKAGTTFKERGPAASVADRRRELLNRIRQISLHIDQINEYKAFPDRFNRASLAQERIRVEPLTNAKKEEIQLARNRIYDLENFWTRVGELRRDGWTTVNGPNGEMILRRPARKDAAPQFAVRFSDDEDAFLSKFENDIRDHMVDAAQRRFRVADPPLDRGMRERLAATIDMPDMQPEDVYRYRKILEDEIPLNQWPTMALIEALESNTSLSIDLLDEMGIVLGRGGVATRDLNVDEILSTVAPDNIAVQIENMRGVYRTLELRERRFSEELERRGIKTPEQYQEASWSEIEEELNYDFAKKLLSGRHFDDPFAAPQFAIRDLSDDELEKIPEIAPGFRSVTKPVYVDDSNLVFNNGSIDMTITLNDGRRAIIGLNNHTNPMHGRPPKGRVPVTKKFASLPDLIETSRVFVHVVEANPKWEFVAWPTDLRRSEMYKRVGFDEVDIPHIDENLPEPPAPPATSTRAMSRDDGIGLSTEEDIQGPIKLILNRERLRTPSRLFASEAFSPPQAAVRPDLDTPPQAAGRSLENNERLSREDAIKRLGDELKSEVAGRPSARYRRNLTDADYVDKLAVDPKVIAAARNRPVIDGDDVRVKGGQHQGEHGQVIAVREKGLTVRLDSGTTTDMPKNRVELVQATIARVTADDQKLLDQLEEARDRVDMALRTRSANELEVARADVQRLGDDLIQSRERAWHEKRFRESPRDDPDRIIYTDDEGRLQVMYAIDRTPEALFREEELKELSIRLERNEFSSANARKVAEARVKILREQTEEARKWFHNLVDEESVVSRLNVIRNNNQSMRARKDSSGRKKLNDEYTALQDALKEYKKRQRAANKPVKKNPIADFEITSNRVGSDGTRYLIISHKTDNFMYETVIDPKLTKAEKEQLALEEALKAHQLAKQAAELAPQDLVRRAYLSANQHTLDALLAREQELLTSVNSGAVAPEDLARTKAELDDIYSQLQDIRAEADDVVQTLTPPPEPEPIPNPDPNAPEPATPAIIATAKRLTPTAVTPLADRLTPRPMRFRDYEELAFGRLSPAGKAAKMAGQVPLIHSFVNLYDPSIFMASNPIGRSILAAGKLSQFFNVSTETFHRVLINYKNPFTLNEAGIESVSHLPFGDLHRDWDKWKKHFTPEHDGFMQLLNQGRLEALEDIRLLGIEVPQDWFETFHDFRRVIGKGSIDLKRVKQARAAAASKPNSFKHRFYQTMEQAIENGVRYENDPISLWVTEVHALRQYSADVAFQRSVAMEHGRPIKYAVAQETKLMVSLSGYEYAQAKIAADFVNNSGNRLARPRKPTLRMTRLYQTTPPDGLQQLIDETNALNFQSGLSDAQYKTAYDSLKLRADHFRLKYSTALKEARHDYKMAKEAVQTFMDPDGRAYGRPGEEVMISKAPVNDFPHLQQRMFLAEDIDYLIEHYAKSDNPMVKLARGVSPVIGILKVGQTGLDPGFAFIQGLGVLGLDMANLSRAKVPTMWGKSVFRGLQGFVNPKWANGYWADQIAANSTGWNEFLKHGRILSSHANPEDVARELSGGSLPDRIPGFRRVAGRVDAAFANFMDAASWETWKSLRPLAKTDADLEELGAFVRNLSGRNSAQEIGISSGQEAVERAIMYARSFTRAGAAITAKAVFDPASFGGRQAVKAMAGLVAAGSMLMMGAALINHTLINGESIDTFGWESTARDIKNSWRPWDKNFMSIRIGKNWIGFGGAQRGLLSLMGRWIGEAVKVARRDGVSIEYALDHLVNPMELSFGDSLDVGIGTIPFPDKLGFKGGWDHPFFKTIRSKGSPPLGGFWDMASGKTYMGRTLDDPKDYLQNFGVVPLPFALQSYIENSGHAGFKERVGMALLDWMGIRNQPVYLSVLHKEQAEADLHHPWEELKGTPLLRNAENDQEHYPELYRLAQLIAEENNAQGSPFQATADLLDNDRLKAMEGLTTGNQGATSIAWGQVGGAGGFISNYTYVTANLANDSKVAYAAAGIPLDEVPDAPESVQEALQQEYYALNPMLPQFRDVEGQPDFDKYYAARDRVLEKMHPDFAGAIRNKKFNTGFPALNDALRRQETEKERLDTYFNAPKYKNLTVAEGERLDKFDTLVTQVQQAMSLGGNSISKADIWLIIYQARLLPANIAAVGFLSSKTALAPLVRDTTKRDLVMNNPDFAVFYDFVYYDLNEEDRALWQQKYGTRGSYSTYTPVSAEFE